jgi:hypothetical protein
MLTWLYNYFEVISSETKEKVAKLARYAGKKTKQKRHT